MHPKSYILNVYKGGEEPVKVFKLFTTERNLIKQQKRKKKKREAFRPTGDHTSVRADVRLHSLINDLDPSSPPWRVFISRYSSTRDDLRCPFTPELVCLCGDSSMKTLEANRWRGPWAGVAPYPQTHRQVHTGKEPGHENDAAQDHFFNLILITFVYSNRRNFKHLHCSNSLII